MDYREMISKRGKKLEERICLACGEKFFPVDSRGIPSAKKYCPRLACVKKREREKRAQQKEKRRLMEKRKKFKKRELVQKVEENVEEFGRLSRLVGVVIEKNRPIFEGEHGDERGPVQVDVVICRGHNKLSFTAEEAGRIADLLGKLIPAAVEAEKTCHEEREAWKNKNERRYEPGHGREVMSPGKTQRTKEKRRKKAAGA